MTRVYYADRKPTAEDGNDHGVVIGIKADGSLSFIHWKTDWDRHVAWMRISDLPPLPPRKIWRTPTQADLVGKTEPIPCRLRESGSDWQGGKGIFLYGFGINGKFVVLVHGRLMSCEYCEIEVDA